MRKGCGNGSSTGVENEIKQYLVSKNCEKTYYHCMEVGEYAYQLGEKYLTSPEK